MKKFYLIKNPYLFQGEEYLKKNKNYFEGWYFKNSNGRNTISFIPGISINKNRRKAFIQVITNDKSYYIDYDIKDFKFNYKPFSIEIGNNYFSKDRLHIDINSKSDRIKVRGDVKYTNGKNIRTNIMGPFSYISFMECNHAILSMKNNVNGKLKINNKEIKFNDGYGYIEKDWGCSFPKSYIWLQGNNFKDKNTSFMLSIATIPFKVLEFRGLICSLIIKDKEYRFATYNNTRLIEYKVDSYGVNITLKKWSYILKIKSTIGDGNKLVAPVNGKMSKNIIESISSKITINLIKNNETIFSDTSTNCGVEIVL